MFGYNTKDITPEALGDIYEHFAELTNEDQNLVRICYQLLQNSLLYAKQQVTSDTQDPDLLQQIRMEITEETCTNVEEWGLAYLDGLINTLLSDGDATEAGGKQFTFDEAEETPEARDIFTDTPDIYSTDSSYDGGDLY